MKSNSIYLALFLSWILITISNASTPTRSYEVQAMIWDDGAAVTNLYGAEEGEVPPAGQVLYLATGDGQTQEVMVPFSSPSRPILVTGTGDIVFYKQPFNPETPDAVPPIAARIQTSQGVRNALVFMVPRSLEHNDYQAAVIDNSVRNFPSNTLRVINMSRDTLGLSFGGEQIIIQPGSRHNFNMDTTKQTAFLLVLQNLPGRNRPVYKSSRIPVYEGARATCLLIPDPVTGKIRIQSIVDSPTEDPEED